MSGQYHNALYTGDVEERIKILKTLGQGTCSFINDFRNTPSPHPKKKTWTPNEMLSMFYSQVIIISSLLPPLF